jgi:hypothetical protein
MEDVNGNAQDDSGVTPVGERVNRVHWFAGRVHEVLDEVAPGGRPVVGTLSGGEAAEAVVELVRARARIEGLLLAVLGRADAVDVGAQQGATSTAAWLGHATATPVGRAHRLVRLARRLEEHPVTGAAVQAGTVDLEQARVITEAVHALPGRVPAADRDRAERHLIGEAAHHDATRLARLGKHLLAVIDPEAADAELARALEREEAAAARKTMLRLVDEGTGVCHGSFRIPSLHAAMLTKALHALASPKRPDPIPRQATDPEDRVVTRATAEVLGEALCQLLERFPTRRLPKAGGMNATVVVTIGLDTLLSGVGAATLDTGGHLSVGAVRRLACQAGVIPAVLGSRSEVLDAGRRVRFHTPIQRTLLTVRDHGCTALGCDRPAAWCHAHHDLPFSQGGPTDLRNGRLLCPRHHTLVHHPGYQVTTAGNGKIRITRTHPRRQ